MRYSVALVLLLVMAIQSTGCSGPTSGTASARQTPTDASDNVVNLFIWADYIAPSTVASFEKTTGIKVRVTNFETNETLESRMLTGHSGFDVVVPTAPYLQRQIRSGAYQALDRTELPHWPNLDPAIMARVALNDPGNVHGIVYAWGTYGIGYNVKRVAAILPEGAPDSWRVIFDPVYASKFAACGINILDAPAGIVRLVLKYLNRNPNAPTPQDLADAEQLLLKIRPYIRNIDSSIGTEAIANGDVCLALDYNGTVFQARHRALDAKNGIDVGYTIPKEGSLLWFDMLAIPRDAPHAANAHRLIDFLMIPQVIADNTRFIGNANANASATPLLDASIRGDAMVYPTPEQRATLFVQTEDSPGQARAITRLWRKFKTGQ